VRIELDFPPSELFPNRAKGVHWGKLYKLRSDYRENSTWLAKHQINGWKHQGGNIKLTLTFEMPDKRKRDADNCLAAAKGALDGLADALFVNDQLFQPILIYRQEGKKPGKLIVDIEELT
jgi:crossover junction endodeoxyribonuclease RusA